MKVSVRAVPLADLSPAPWNPRAISDERFENLCRSIEADPEFLWRRPVLAQADGTIYGGNQRFRAAERLGMETIPAIVEDVPDQLARERALRDNAQWGDWEEDELATFLHGLREQGSDLDLLGFDERDLQMLLDRIDRDGDGLTDPDDVPEVPEEPITKPGDLWLLGDHRLLCGDATNMDDVARLMNGEQAKLMATDPPYLVDYTAASGPPSRAKTAETNWDEFKDVDQAVAFYAAFIEAALPHLVEKAPIYQWHANTRQSVVDAAWLKTGLLAHQVIIWVKTRGVFTRSHYMWQHEPCMYGWRQGKMPRLKPPTTGTTVWQVDQKGEQDENHPTQKPVELFKRPLLYHTRPGDLCYEPFLGSGTCMIAAEMTERRCYAIEQEPRYVDQSVRRWVQLTGKTAIREVRA